ncbi:MAG: hypothetical protein PUP92_05440 [Rhizonema sp. PD38]|nr:hypothetical protein [Rhizonema sp. PD38]
MFAIDELIVRAVRPNATDVVNAAERSGDARADATNLSCKLSKSA